MENIYSIKKRINTQISEVMNEFWRSFSKNSGPIFATILFGIGCIFMFFVLLNDIYFIIYEIINLLLILYFIFILIGYFCFNIKNKKRIIIALDVASDSLIDIKMGIPTNNEIFDEEIHEIEMSIRILRNIKTKICDSKYFWLIPLRPSLK